MPDLSKYSALQMIMVLQEGVLAYSPDDLQKVVPIGKTKIYEELNSGRLVAKKLGDKTVIPFWSAIDWLEALPNYPVAIAPEAPSLLTSLAEARQKLSGLVHAPDPEAASVKNLTGNRNAD